jgi:hypothetical protein
MFPRWQRRQRYKRGAFRWNVARHLGRRSEHGSFESVPVDKWVRLAYLVESVRTPAGPRQRNICYLGSVREGHEQSDYCRGSFWRVAAKNLRKAKVAGADLAGVVAKLEAVVPMPDGFEPGWDEHWRWLPAPEEIQSAALCDACMAVEAARDGAPVLDPYWGRLDEARRGGRWYRRCFWHYATAEMDRAGIAGDDRARIEATLEALVPRPTVR